jgi:hypothetical protein
MSEPTALEKLLNEGDARRLWLLYHGLQHRPLDEAIELARVAEEFLIGNRSPRCFSDRSKAPDAPAEPSSDTSSSVAGVSQRVAGPRSSPVVLSAAQRKELLARLAKGDKNAKIAEAFGLTPKQVQGYRMGCAREIAARGVCSDAPQADAAQENARLASSVDDIVRFLRQHDDVVVAQPGGGFLVNGRFSLNAAELLSRANRMRDRQGNRNSH